MKYWTKEKCHEIALQYETREELLRDYPSIPTVSYKGGWWDDICSHMTYIQKPNGYWTKEKCRDEALKYDTKQKFRKLSRGAHNHAYRNNFLDEICEHMQIVGNLYKRCIYAFEFSDKCVYIGLTSNLECRKYQHLNSEDSAVYKHILYNKISPYIKKLTDYIACDLAKIKEAEYIEKYRDLGYTILNRRKAGAVGCNNIIWTYEKCKLEALKYDTKTQFNVNSRGAYMAAHKNKWLFDICQHMPKRFKQIKN